MPIGTAHMASLCLPNSTLLWGAEWQEREDLRRLLGEAGGTAMLLYPGEEATDLAALPVNHPLTLVVVDGTWANTKKMVNQNPVLASLPRLAFTPSQPSEYRIRREPKAHCVSTIEALAIVLGALEGEPERFRSLLVPFREMVDRQLELKAARDAAPKPRKKKPRPRLHSPIPKELLDRPQDILCVVGEANAWPWRSGERHDRYPDELVHWVAVRPGTGELFECRIAPRHPLAPNTPCYVELSPEQLHGGVSVAEFEQRWQSFLRERDILCSWGCYATALFSELGAKFPSLCFDLRAIVKDALKRNIGTVEHFLEGLDATPVAPLTIGRAGRRLAQLGIIAQRFSRTHPHQWSNEPRPA